MKRRLGPTTAFRLAIGDREAARRSLARILEWDFDRILPGHGETVPSNGRTALREGFARLLS
jgi:glyoxylase-like metal-dependent hydrolase (beta-lactamase superfamily II)